MKYSCSMINPHQDDEDEDDEEDDDDNDDDDDTGVPVVEDGSSDSSDDFDKVDSDAGQKAEFRDKEFSRITTEDMDPCEQVEE